MLQPCFRLTGHAGSKFDDHCRSIEIGDLYSLSVTPVWANPTAPLLLPQPIWLSTY
jgi:hypothetical protein